MPRFCENFLDILQSVIYTELYKLHKGKLYTGIHKGVKGMFHSFLLYAAI